MNKDFTNKELITGCTQNNRVYQEALYRKYCPQLIRIGYRFTQDQELLISWINDGFLKVFHSIGKLENQDGQQLDGWVRTVVYRSMIDGVRKEKKYWNQVLVDETEITGSSEIEFDFEFNEIMRVIDKLPQEERQVFSLYFFDGLTHQEIGNQIGVSDGTSKWRLHQARKMIQEQLKYLGYAR